MGFTSRFVNLQIYTIVIFENIITYHLVGFSRFPYYTWVRIITHIPNGVTPCFITIQRYNLFTDFVASQEF